MKKQVIQNRPYGNSNNDQEGRYQGDDEVLCSADMTIITGQGLNTTNNMNKTKSSKNKKSIHDGGILDTCGDDEELDLNMIQATHETKTVSTLAEEDK